MVNAKLHIICGNCGSNDNFSLTNDEGGLAIACGNCATLHFLDSLMPKEYPVLPPLMPVKVPEECLHSHSGWVAAGMDFCPNCKKDLKDE